MARQISPEKKLSNSPIGLNSHSMTDVVVGEAFRTRASMPSSGVICPLMKK
jgi:hypothetical protein